MSSRPPKCNHITGLHPQEPRTPDGCEECLASGGEWVHLRLCLTCGHVGCCDESPNKHATKHFHKTQHPVIRSFEPGEEWGYCYVDDVGFEPMPTFGLRVLAHS
jgi:uncharacterized UBP type Zn finger protein